MIDLLNFYDENSKDTYFEKFKDKIEREGVSDPFNFKFSSIEKIKYEVFDTEEAKVKFLEIVQPNAVEQDSIPHLKSWFYLLTFYFWKNGISLKQFPKAFERPIDLFDFGYNQIRQYAFSELEETGGSVAWATRRKIISELVFIQNEEKIIPSKKLQSIIQMIDTNNLKWQEMTLDSKIKNLNDGIEFILKKGRKFIDVPDIDNIEEFALYQKYRNFTQMERHSSGVEERKKLSDSEKIFLVDYGVALLHLAIRNLEL